MRAETRTVRLGDGTEVRFRALNDEEWVALVEIQKHDDEIETRIETMVQIIEAAVVEPTSPRDHFRSMSKAGRFKGTDLRYLVNAILAFSAEADIRRVLRRRRAR